VKKKHSSRRLTSTLRRVPLAGRPDTSKKNDYTPAEALEKLGTLEVLKAVARLEKLEKIGTLGANESNETHDTIIKLEKIEEPQFTKGLKSAKALERLKKLTTFDALENLTSLAAFKSLKSPEIRVTWLLQELYGNNQREMAESVGISQAAISKIVSGKQGVGMRTLAAIASDPRINANWLFSGEGEPLQVQGGTIKKKSLKSQQAESSAGPKTLQQSEEVAEEKARDIPAPKTLPVSRTVLAGFPHGDAHVMSGSSFPVPEFFYGDSRYWFEIGKDEPILHAEASFQAGDLLLIETDPAFWSGNLQQLDGKFAGISLATKSGTALVMARVRFDLTTLCLHFDLFGAKKRTVGATVERQGLDSSIDASRLVGVCQLIVRRA
jgi:transcriptional regulator with XRE-family HTH domain